MNKKTKSKTKSVKPEKGEVILSGADSSLFEGNKVDGRQLKHKDLEEILRDGYVRSLWEKRRGGIVAVDWIVQPATDAKGKISPSDQVAADFISGWIDTIGFDKITKKMMSAIWYGYSVAQVCWEVVDGKFVPEKLKVHNPKSFKWNNDKSAWTMGQDQLLADKKYWIFTAEADHDDIPYGRGLGLDVHLAWYLRKHGWKFWAEYLQKFGGPTVKGTMPADLNDDDAKKFEEALQDMHSMGWIAMPDGYNAEILDGGAKGSKSNHELFMDKWDSMLPTIILGQTMTTQNGSSQSQATVHKGVQDDIVQGDADLLCESFNNTVIKWIVELNFPNTNPPKVWRRISQEEDLTVRASREETIARATGFRPTLLNVKEVYGGDWEENPNGGTSPNPSFADSDNSSLNTSINASNDEDAITALTDDLDGAYGEANPFAQFAEDLVNKYDSLEALNADWGNIEKSFMDNSALLEFAKKLKNGISASVLNGALSVDKEIG